MDKDVKPLILTIRNRQDLLYHGEVKTITSYNDKGIFDVLSKHANFIALIQKKLIYKDLSNKIAEIEIDNGIMRVLDNQVDIFIGISMDTKASEKS